MENPLGTAVGVLRASLGRPRRGFPRWPLGQNLIGLLAASLVCSVAGYYTANINAH